MWTDARRKRDEQAAERCVRPAKTYVHDDVMDNEL